MFVVAKIQTESFWWLKWLFLQKWKLKDANLCIFPELRNSSSAKRLKDLVVTSKVILECSTSTLAFGGIPCPLLSHPFSMNTHTHTHVYLSVCVCLRMCLCIYIYIYRVSLEGCARLRESIPYVKIYRYNPKHLYPKLNGYGDNGQRKMRSSCGCTYCTFSADPLCIHCACP